MESSYIHVRPPEELKPCPFCGGEAELMRVSYGHSSGVLKDSWKVVCGNGCCEIKSCEDLITRDETGVSIITDGIEKAINAWNTRTEVETNESGNL